ncbi:hypothetical protein [Streptomyces californicus]|uniref:hypothetical protein n=1 Tax=Streptomyces californicus TaxID=67351 RepID=UPI00331D2CCC
MTAPGTPEWLQRAQSLHDELATLCTDFTALPIEERLTSLAHLDHTLNAHQTSGLALVGPLSHTFQRRLNTAGVTDLFTTHPTLDAALTP